MRSSSLGITRYMAGMVTLLLVAGLATAGRSASLGLYGGVSYLDARELASEIERRQEDLERARKRIEEIEARVALLEPDIAASEEERRAQALKARRTIILHDRMARGGWLRTAFSSSSLTELAVFSRLYSMMLDREGEALAELLEKEDALLEKRNALEADLEVLEQLRAGLETHKQELEAKRQTLISIQGGGYNYGIR